MFSKIRCFTFLSLFVPILVCSQEVNLEEIDPTLNLIQVAALEKRKNILYIKDFFSEDAIFLKLGADYTRVYLVNIEKEYLKSTLQRVRRKYSSAFVATYKINEILNANKNIYSNEPSSREMLDMPLLNGLYTPEFIPYNKILNRKSILKTRKKFF